MADTEHSLEFDNLPLVVVEMRLFTAKPVITLDLRTAARLEEALAGNGMDAKAVYNERDFTEQNPPAAAAALVPPTIQQIVGTDLTRSIHVTIQNDMVKVHWQKMPVANPPSYPRYNALEQQAQWALNLVKTMASEISYINGIANMTYSNFIAADASTADAAFRILDGRYRDAIPPNSVQLHEINLRWRQPTGLDRALYLAMAEQVFGNDKSGGFLLRTITGKRIADDDPIAAMRLCHSDLQSFFVECTSVEARKKWGQKDA